MTPRGPRLAKVLVVVLPRSRLVGRLRRLVRGFGLMGPVPEGGVTLHQVDPDAFPVGRDSVPGADLGTTREGLLAETASLRGGHDP